LLFPWGVGEVATKELPSAPGKPVDQQTKPLGQRLLEAGLISEDQLNLALREIKRLGIYLGEALVNLGFVTQEILTVYLAQTTKSEVVDLSTYFIKPEVLELVPYAVARRFPVLPLKLEGNLLTVALANTMDVVAVDTLERLTGHTLDVVSASSQNILDALDQHYARSGSIDDTIDQLLKQGLDNLGEEARAEAPMVRLCNQIITLAVKNRATDIHVEPDEKVLRIRMRIDGMLRQEVFMPKQLQLPVIARLKLMANLNVTEKRLPQDGHITFTIGHRTVDLRISTLPTSFGESVVMRILDKTSVKLELTELGFPDRDRATFESAISRTHGILLVTGPTGSGKNTTLYTGLMLVNALERSIFTLEDPIEYEFPLVRQTQINPDVGMTFPVGLRALLRQDPDVIMVGEIRDQETAQLAVRAAFTGHLVLSTLHTNDAVGAIPRLLEMGIEPYILPSVMIGVIGQRLIRAICAECKVEREDAETILKGLKIPVPEGMVPQLWKGAGCGACGGTGYRGRLGIFEMFLMDERFHDPIARRLDVPKIHQLAKESGMQSMLEDGIHKALTGVTTVEEIIRVIHG